MKRNTNEKSIFVPATNEAGTMLSTCSVLFHLILTHHLYEIVSNIIPILWLRKYRLREVKQFSQSHTVLNDRTKNTNSYLNPKPMFLVIHITITSCICLSAHCSLYHSPPWNKNGILFYYLFSKEPSNAISSLKPSQNL